jgi:hypothetical protein
MIGPCEREQHALGQAEREVGPHLGDPLQRGAARRGDLAGVAGRGEVAGAEAGVIMAWADQAVEVDLLQHIKAGRHG